jgi:hypothetical protein
MGVAAPTPMAPRSKSFLVLFLQKKNCFLAIRNTRLKLYGMGQ